MLIGVTAYSAQIYLIYSNGSLYVFEGEQLMCRDPDFLLSYNSDEEMR